MENNKKDHFQQGQQGTGSAEQTGRSRDEQKNDGSLHQDHQDIADNMGNDKDRMTSLRDMGSLSGRDDYAGGMNDDMSNQSTNEPTDRP